MDFAQGYFVQDDTFANHYSAMSSRSSSDSCAHALRHFSTSLCVKMRRTLNIRKKSILCSHFLLRQAHFYKSKQKIGKVRIFKMLWNWSLFWYFFTGFMVFNWSGFWWQYYMALFNHILILIRAITILIPSFVYGMIIFSWFHPLKNIPPSLIDFLWYLILNFHPQAP